MVNRSVYQPCRIQLNFFSIGSCTMQHTHLAHGISHQNVRGRVRARTSASQPNIIIINDIIIHQIGFACFFVSFFVSGIWTRVADTIFRIHRRQFKLIEFKAFCILFANNSPFRKVELIKLEAALARHTPNAARPLCAKPNCVADPNAFP